MLLINRKFLTQTQRFLFFLSSELHNLLLNFLRHLIPMQSHLVDILVLNQLGFLNFFVKLVFSLHLQMNDVNRILHAVHRSQEMVFIGLQFLIEIAFRPSKYAEIINDAYIA